MYGKHQKKDADGNPKKLGNADVTDFFASNLYNEFEKIPPTILQLFTNVKVLELEAIGLSRDIPGSFRWLIEPIVRRVSQASLSASLRQTEKAVRAHTELANGVTGSAGSMASTTSKAHSSH